MKTLLILVFTAVIVVATAALLQAQPSLPTGPSQAPIEGGLSLVAAAGATYAYKKMKKKKTHTT